jgi:hypothetical protein
MAFLPMLLQRSICRKRYHKSFEFSNIVGHLSISILNNSNPPITKPSHPPSTPSTNSPPSH